MCDCPNIWRYSIYAFLTKVDKFGMITIYAMIVGLFCGLQEWDTGRLFLELYVVLLQTLL